MSRGQIHRFEVHGRKLVLDVHSGSLHQVDDLVWELLEYYPDDCTPETLAPLRGRFGAEAVDEALAELDELVERGWLFSPEPDWGDLLPRGDEPLRAICLNVAHACNLSCTYCFADKGRYGGPGALMPAAVARQAVDLLLRLSRERPVCEVDFFGGEPLLNWPVVQDTVRYARQAAAAAGKEMVFTLTTNGTLLTPEILDFLDRERVSLILSVDGRPWVHDAMRSGSYDGVAQAVRAVLARRAPGGVPAWAHGAAQGVSGAGAYAVVRGTFTSRNLDFAEDAVHLMDVIGAPHFAIEPVVLRPEDPNALRPEHIPAVAAEYERLAAILAERQRQGKVAVFHHFALEADQGPCLPRRIQGCGAGLQYLAVTPEGDLYPCHQFVGRPRFKLGTVWTGITATEVQQELVNCHVYSKAGCRECWVRYYCSGGCHANAELVTGDIHQPDPVGCALVKKRVECALWLRAQAETGEDW
ncbi:thioether cross-link-forming SCIFF peptide maturase [Caldinitratiruptor microaerophilus]|uniref:Thioether cross-link-forming SCIFF peptide maturase n=1 Tax=Caldinitratiruptor microaerophilus TaxID=671077 RepID=A0AA35G622_9FIRM|nr:thioether cross-link-forming SCIFF peptide maturase [Caldinitratiruptor microaerophilus]BDG60571.1 thioether cross-link-forming SCIFF peptide maturase [Caldinitratiruptor microaerophilus]